MIYLIFDYRVDKEFFLGNLDSNQAKQMFENFYPSSSESTLRKMLLKFDGINKNNPVSPAAFENYLSRCESGDNEAIVKLDDLEKNVKTNKESEDDDKTIVYRYNSYDKKWVTSGKPRIKRSWESLVHQPELKQKLLNDVTLFLQNQKLYQTNGILFRRNYLFYGPHGTGKSSMVHCLAGKLNYSICRIDLSEKELTANGLLERLEEVPSRCLILIENIDNTVSSPKNINVNNVKPDEQERDRPKNNFSAIEFCNILESFEAETSPIVIMTAGNKKDIAPELLQPGRYLIFDKKLL